MLRGSGRLEESMKAVSTFSGNKLSGKLTPGRAVVLSTGPTARRQPGSGAGWRAPECDPALLSKRHECQPCVAFS